MNHRGFEIVLDIWRSSSPINKFEVFGPKKSKFYNYLQLMNSETEYGKRMTRLRCRIFNEPARPSQKISKNMKVIKILTQEPIHKREEITQYYPRHPETHTLIMALRDYGLFRDEHQDFKEEMIRLRTLRGKPPWNPQEKYGKKKK